MLEGDQSGAPAEACDPHTCPHCAGHPAGDPLTGLADRPQLFAALRHAPGAAGGAGSALLMIDLDRFKLVNDTLGHPAGDALLRAAARRLRSSLRPGDLAARLGGDEFALLLGNPASVAGAEALARRLVEVLARPYLTAGEVALVGASIGIAFAPSDAEDAGSLVKCADLALYAAKAAGRGCVRRFEPGMRTRAEERRLLEQALRAALPLGQFELHYQPQIAVVGRCLTGFEALIRWRHPQRGMVPPDAFLPLATELGLLPAIGAWVLRAACTEAAGWPGRLRVAVNVSPVQLEAGGLARAVEAALAESGLPADRLELEVTENALMAKTDAVFAELAALRGLGVHLSLDDFGTGFSSLTQLRSLPFDRIKIDRSFAADTAVVRVVAALGRALGMSTTAEGVETPDQLDAMAEEGVTEAQGYLIGRPAAAMDLPAIIDQLAGGRAAT